MKKWTIIFVLFSLPYMSKAQNLVPNFSFEINIDCPNNWGQSNKIINWYNPSTASPEYFCECGYLPLDMGLPDIVEPKDSSCFIGVVIGTYYLGQHPLADSREYLTVKLNEELKTENHYCISFYCLVSKNSKYFIDKIGALFSSDSIFQSDQFIIENSSRILMSNSIITDTLEWVLLEKEYIAIGNEKYLTIGSFWRDIESNVILNPNGTSSTYLFIDDVKIVNCTKENNNIHHSIYPNPSSSGQFTVEVHDEEAVEVSVHNEIGQLIYYELLPEGATQKSIELQLASGVYLVSFSRRGNRIKTEKVVVLR